MAGAPKATLVVAIPTVDGREDHLERCLHAYHETTPTSVELVLNVVHNRPSCGVVWNETAVLAIDAGATYFHCTADDLEPAPGWYEAAVEQVEAGNSPSALIYTAREGVPDALESHGDWAALMPTPTPVSMSRIPFCRPSQWIEIPNIHYWSDNAFSVAMQVQGIPIIAIPEFRFRHHWAQAGRQDGHGPKWYAEQAEYEAWARDQITHAAPKWS